MSGDFGYDRNVCHDAYHICDDVQLADVMFSSQMFRRR